MGVLKAFNEWPSAIFSLDPSRRIELGEMQHVSIVLKSKGMNVTTGVIRVLGQKKTTEVCSFQDMILIIKSLVENKYISGFLVSYFSSPHPPSLMCFTEG